MPKTNPILRRGIPHGSARALSSFLFLLSFSYLIGQAPHTWSEEHYCELSIVFYQENDQYTASISSMLADGCPSPSVGMEEWADDLVKSIVDIGEIDLGTLSSSILFHLTATGEISEFRSLKKSAKMDQSDSIIASTVMDMGNWSHSYENWFVLRMANREFEVFVIVEQSAKFPGGSEALHAYLQENLSYPEKALRSGIEGRVFVQFIIERDGSLSNIEILKGIGSGCDEEVIRLIKEMPNWKPGKQRGEPVRQKYIQSVNFKISKKKKRKSKKKKY